MGRYRQSLLIFGILFGTSVRAQFSGLVFPGSDGKLKYTPYANVGETNAVNTVPDFSFAGYQGGGVPLPDVPVKADVTPGTGDMRSRIQDAVNAVSGLPLDKNGFRGAVLLKKGLYQVSDSIVVRTSGVVLRGEGQNSATDGGTELVSTAKSQFILIQFKGQDLTQASGIVLDTKNVPPLHAWIEFEVGSAVQQELSGNRIASFKVVSNMNDYVAYDSRENTHKPILEVRTDESTADSLVTLIAVADAFVQGGASANTNFGADSSLAVKNAGVNNRVTREIYLRFDLSHILGRVQRARLKLYGNNDGLAGHQNSVILVNDDSWNEMTITYATRPDEQSMKEIRISSSFVPTGARSFDVQDASGFVPGDRIIVLRTPNQKWIDILQMAQYGWTTDYYRIGYERTITGIQGNTITIDIPMVQALSDSFGGGLVYKNFKTGRIGNCGIENLFLSSVYTKDDDESHGWTAVSFTRTENCWVRNVTARYFGYSAVLLDWAFWTTIQDCAMLDPKSITTGSRKYSFNINKGSFNLFQRCYTRGGRHDFVTGSQVAGPNVFVDCYAMDTYADIGPHHRYATGLLFDNVYGGQIQVQNRKDMGSGHGWAGAQTLFWNCATYKNNIRVESPIGAMNWGIGCIAPVLDGNGTGYWESKGVFVTPRSLYYKQLEDRLGAEAVDDVILPEQRKGVIWNRLAEWAGIGNLTEVTRIPGGESAPCVFSLEQNFPNPFNPTTTVEYSTEKSGNIDLVVIDLLGRKIKILATGRQAAGSHTAQWDGTDRNGRPVPGGVYICRLESEEAVLSRKLLLIR